MIAPGVNVTASVFHGQSGVHTGNVRLLTTMLPSRRAIELLVMVPQAPSMLPMKNMSPRVASGTWNLTRT